MPEGAQAGRPAFEPAISLDLRGSILGANSHAAALLGLPLGQWRAKPLVVFICNEYRPALLRVLRGFRQSSTTSETLRCELEPRAGEQRVPVLLTFSRSESQERPLTVTLQAGDGDAAAVALTGRLTELERRYRETVASIDIGLRPRPLQVQGLDLGFEAISGDPDVPVGGDLCDWQVLADGQVHLCVVDATGRGLLATRAALVVRSTVRLLAMSGCPLEDLLERAEQVSEQQEPGIGAAVSVARYRPEDGQLWVSNAGNPPPLIQRRDGSVSRMDLTGTPFGHGNSRRRPLMDLRLGPDEAFVLYTDGLLEAHGTPREGVEDLRRRLEQLGRQRHEQDRDQEAVRIAHALLPSGSTDDALALVVRRSLTGPRERSTTSDREFSARLSKAGNQHVAEMRQNLSFWLYERPVPRNLVGTALLIVSELASNAVRAARSQADVRVSIEDRGVQIEVVDDGHGIKLEDLRTSRHGAAGFGLHIIESVCEDIQILPSAAGTVVRCRLPVAR